MRLAVAVAAVLGLSACGTTVPVAHQTLSGVTPPPAGSIQAPAATAPGTLPSTGTGPQPSSSAVPGAASPASAAPLPEAVAGVATSGPIAVGVLTVNNDAAAGAGVSNGNTFTPRKAYGAAIAAWNAKGGVAGHRIDPLYVEVKSSSTDIGADLEAACTAFTQDHHVAVVLSVTGVFDEDFTQCLARRGTPLITNDDALGDEQSLRAASTLIALTGLTTDDRATQLLQRFVQAGRLTRSSKLGVVVEGCAFNQRTYDRTLVPLASRLGLTIARTATTRCFHGIQDLGGQAADLQSAVLQFQSSAVSDVLFVSGSFEGNLMLLFATAASSQQYHPRYALTSAVAATVQEANTPKDELRNAAGLGWEPEVDSDKAGVTLPAQKACLASLRSRGVSPASSADLNFAFSACDGVGMLDAALRAGGPLVTAVHRIGRGFSSASVYGGATDFSGSRRTGPATGRVFAWQDGCGCFDYTGPVFPLTS